MKTEVEPGGTLPQACAHREQEKSRKDSPPQLSEGAEPYRQSRDFGYLASRTMREYFCCLRHKVCSNLLQSPQDPNAGHRLVGGRGGSLDPKGCAFDHE